MPSFPKNMKVSKTELSQTFDLEKMFSVDLSNNVRLKEEIGQEMIEIIKSRTLDNNKDLWGSSFVKYSKAYTGSDTFKDFDKAASEINMQLTGKMLESLDLSHAGNSLTIMVADQGELLKAYNHQTGDTVPQRAWFGISAKEIEEIKSIFGDEIKELKSEIKKAKDAARPTALDLLTGAGVVAENNEQLFNDLLTVSFPDLGLSDIDV